MEPSVRQLKELKPEDQDFKILVPHEIYQNYHDSLPGRFSLEIFKKYIRDDSLFIDVGAHYGYDTLLVGATCHGCRIIAFESSLQKFEILKENIALNKLNNIEAYNNLFMLNIVFKNISYSRLIIKLDIKGQEVSVLNEMKDLLKQIEDAELFIQFDPESIKNSGNEPESLLRLIEDIGFDIFIIEDNHREIYKLRTPGDWNNYFSQESVNGNLSLLCIKKERSLNLCIFSHTSQLAGAERSLIELISELTRNYGVLCTVIIPNDGPLKERLENEGASVIAIKYHWWCDAGLQSSEAIRTYYGDSLQGLHKNIRKIAKINPDVILTNTMVIPWGIISALALNRPHVWYVREFGELDHGLKFYIPFQDVIDIIKSSDLVIANSEAVSKTLFKEYSNNVAIIYNHIDISSTAKVENCVECFTHKDSTKLIIAGYISELKGQMDAILAVKELVNQGKDVELIIMGEASPGYLDELKDTIRTNNLCSNVRFINFQDNPYTIIGQADIVLICSKNEAFGRSIIEAWLLKKPIVAADSGGVPELVKEGFNGLLYKPGVYTQLALKISYLIDNKNIMMELGQNGYDFSRMQFTEEKYGGKVYKSLINLKKGSNQSSPIPRFLVNVAGQVITVQDAELNRVRTELDAREREINKAKTELGSIKNSLTWRSVVKFQRFIDKTMPYYTRRRAVFEKIFALVRNS